VRISGFENDTQFPGFLSVQRLSRKLGKSDAGTETPQEPGTHPIFGWKIRRNSAWGVGFQMLAIFFAAIVG